jgi:HSP20 family protein
MAQQAPISKSQVESPAIHVGPPNDGIKEMLDSIARRAFEIFNSSGHSLGHDLANWFQAERELLHPAHLNVSESDGSFTVNAEVPGFAAENLEVNIEGRRVTISGKRESHEERKDKKTTIYSEACSDHILRVAELPGEVTPDGAKATLKNGMLELQIPKAAPAKKIPIAAKTS